MLPPGGTLASFSGVTVTCRPPLRKPAAGIGLFAVAFQLYDYLTLGVFRRIGTVIVYTIPFGLSA